MRFENEKAANNYMNEMFKRQQSNRSNSVQQQNIVVDSASQAAQRAKFKNGGKDKK